MRKSKTAIAINHILVKAGELAMGLMLLAGAFCCLPQPALAGGAVWNELPIHREPGKDWWDTDPEQYRALMALERKQPDQLIRDAETLDGQTFAVKQGSVVEVRFSQYFDGKKFWRFDKKAGPVVERIYMDWFGPFKDGSPQLDRPGHRIFRFQAINQGLLTLTFSCNDTSDPDPLPVTTPECTGGTVVINFDIK